MEAKVINMTAKHAALAISRLDNRLLDNNGRIRLLPASFYRQIDHEKLILWCNRRAIYVVPTYELVTWLHKRIRGRKAIEIGAGNADLGYHLGIPMTDSYVQLRPEIQLYYNTAGVAITRPKADGECLDAAEALVKYRPDVVIGAYISQKAYDDKEKASFYGPEEKEILCRVENYIHIGNENTHGTKRILEYQHEVYYPDWLITRAIEPHKNCIFVW